MLKIDHEADQRFAYAGDQAPVFHPLRPLAWIQEIPLWRRNIESTTRTPVDMNSDCQFWNDSNQSCGSVR